MAYRRRKSARRRARSRRMMSRFSPMKQRVGRRK